MKLSATGPLVRQPNLFSPSIRLMILNLTARSNSVYNLVSSFFFIIFFFLPLLYLFWLDTKVVVEQGNIAGLPLQLHGSLFT